MRSHLIAALLASSLLAGSAAAMMLPVPLDQAARDADAIVHTKVLERVSAMDPHTKVIHTDVTLEVLDSWKGAPAKHSRITVRVMGGIVGDLGMWREHEPVFEAGEESIVFLEAHAEAPWRVHALEQGKFVVRNGAAHDLKGKRLMLSDFKTSVARHMRAGTMSEVTP